MVAVLLLAIMMVAIIVFTRSSPNKRRLLCSCLQQASLGIPQRKLRPLLKRSQQLFASQPSPSPASPRKAAITLPSLRVLEKLLEGAVTLVSQFNPAECHGDLVTVSVEFWTWVRRRLLFTSATISDMSTHALAPLSAALLPVTSVLSSLLSSIQVLPELVTGNESLDVLVLLQNLLQNFRTFAIAFDAPLKHTPLPVALLFFHSIYTVIESDDESFRDLRVEEDIREIGFIRVPQSWLTQDSDHVLPVVARLVAVLGLGINEAEGLFAAALLYFLKDRCRPSHHVAHSLISLLH